MIGEKLSVIVPVYNVEKYLNRCLDSIINQTYQNLEIILVDDGSKDNSGRICDEYAKKDNRIRVIHKENNGAAAARNTGIENSTGEYIAFVDSDDYIDVVMYEKMMEINKQYDCDVVMCDCYKERKDSKIVYTHDIREGYYNKDMLYEEYFDCLLMTNEVEYPPTISNWVCIFKKSLIMKNHLRYAEGMRFSEDLLFGSQAMYYANNFYYMKNQCYYHYMFNENSVTNTYYKDKWTLMKKLYDQINIFFSNKSDYDFQHQIDLSLLFIVYHCIGNLKNENIDKNVIKLNIIDILSDRNVEDMFKRLNIQNLNISWKLKLKTLFYKYKIKWLLLM